MARLFGDGFDAYATITDAALGRWISFPITTGGSLVTGAFGVGQAWRQIPPAALPTCIAVFETGTNETTVYFSIRMKVGGSLSTQFMGLQLRDGANVQCSIVWACDNAIRIYSGSTAGTLLYTLTNAFYSNTWDGYQGKIVINNTTGSVEIRKNGATSPIINLSNVNTRAGSTNAYANQFAMVPSNVGGQQYDIDDIWLSSDNGAAPTSWPGDVRCVTNMPTSDSSVQFAKGPTSITAYQSLSVVANAGPLANIVWLKSVVASQSGTVSALVANFALGFTGHVNMALYDASGPAGGPGALIAVATAITNPTLGTKTFTMSSPPNVVRDTTYWLAMMADVSIAGAIPGPSLNNPNAFANTYASGFPPVAGVGSAGNVTGFGQIGMTVVPTNSSLVSDSQQDGDTSYVYDSIVGHKDKYGFSALSVTPATIHGVAPFVFWKKSDTGARTGTISVTANGSADTVVAGITGIAPSLSYVYNTAFMPLDPTGAAWTTANVNSMLLGLTVAS